MQYRRLGRSGLRVSELSLGSWVTYHNQVDTGAATEMLAAAMDAGINFFDNAEGYAEGRSEVVMGQALKALARPRMSYVVSTKFFWGLDHGGVKVNQLNTLNRKYLMQAIDGSLKRLQLDHIDLVYCHRADPDTPIEETARAMSDMVTAGKALYWGTSEWTARQIEEAHEVAERLGLHKPVMEQPQYNLFARYRVEREYASLCKRRGMGLTTWSPLAGGLLTGKYRAGVPTGSRATLPGMEWVVDGLTHAGRNAAVAQLEPLAQELGGSVAQLAIAWCLCNPHVSTVILGASRLSQLRDNLGALALVPKLKPELLSRIERITKPLAE
jgi:voltage-dependent potassium channel beta subunit